MSLAEPHRDPDLLRRFAYHPANTTRRVAGHELVRRECHALAELLTQKLPSGRELALAITKLEEAMFWANASIARDPAP